MRSYYKKLRPQDRFARRYCCWANNHHGWKKYRTMNQRITRRKLNRFDDMGCDDPYHCITVV